jgi:plastocyanin
LDRRTLVGAALLAITTSACIFGGGAQTRTVSVDYTSDEFPSAFYRYFPSHVFVHPGDTVLFRQAWSGEAHSVTMGTVADRIEKRTRQYFKVFEEKGYAGLPQNVDIFKVVGDVPLMFTGPSESHVAQNGAQPCYLDQGLPPKDPNKPCTKAEQRQPDFTGRQNWYNSGYIHYAGPTGNTFRMRIAPNATPGSYFFFCNNHGPFMHGYLVIKPNREKIPSQSAANKEAQREINAIAQPLSSAFHDASLQRYPIPDDQVSSVRGAGLPTAQLNGKTVFRGQFAGLGVQPGSRYSNSANIVGFVPKTVQARAGEKVTWVVLGSHTISFNVPKYFPIFTIEKDGTIVRNPSLDAPAGGSPPLPQTSGQSNGPPKPEIVDAGTWNGQGFHSSGLISPDSFGVYSLRFTTPGTYKFACLVHPLMAGTLFVR